MKARILTCVIIALTLTISPAQFLLVRAGDAWDEVKLPSGRVVHLGDPGLITVKKGMLGEAPVVNVVFVLDASGSMNAELPGAGKSRLEVAKEVMAEVLPQLPSEVKGSLWIYGHRYPQKPKDKSCQDIEQVFPLGAVDASAYVENINAISAIGYTPIAETIKKAAQELPPDEYNSILLVSDGKETCGGDPCALAEALKTSDAKVTIHVVGYALKKDEREELECIARVSGGTYHDADDAEGLLQALREAMAATVAPTILRVEVVDTKGSEVDANVYLNEVDTDRRVSGNITWRDNATPPGEFDVIVTTVPWTLYRSLTIEKECTTIVEIPMGSIRVLTPNGEESTVNLFDATLGERLGAYSGQIMVTPGRYQVEINRSVSEAISINPGEEKELTLGTIRVITPDGEDTKVNVFDVTGKRLGSYGGDVLLMPGRYQIEIHNSRSELIILEEGKTKEVQLGAIRPLTPEGEETRTLIYDATGKRLGSYGGTVLLVPGSYKIGIHGSTSEMITVTAGAVEEYHLGAVEVKGSFQVFDQSGKRLGSYGDYLLLVAGTYRVVMYDGPTFENVVVQAGEVTKLE